MSYKYLIAVFTLCFLHSTTSVAARAEKVAEITGVQITGVTVTKKGDIFVNAPNWRPGVPFAVAKISKSGQFQPYPNQTINRCVADSEINDKCFLAVQSVVAHNDKLYVLDTRNPSFKGVKDAPRLFVINLVTNLIERTLILSKQSYHKDSYINDLRVDEKTKRIYMTDSGRGGLVVYNLNDDSSYRILDNHEYTNAEVNQLNVQGTFFNMAVHSDGIALDSTNDTLYFHALTGYNLYAINTMDIQQKENDKLAPKVRKVAVTGAPDGLFYHQSNVYLADLEKNEIQYLTPSLDLRTLVKGKEVDWADTFSIYNNQLYYTNSKIQTAGADVSEMSFEVYKVEIPQKL